MDKSSLGDRMKGYENVTRNYLTRRMPVIIRLDGKAFSTLTSKMDKPYDHGFKNIMMHVAEYLVENIMGCKLAYVQSDEISLLITDYDKLETDSRTLPVIPFRVLVRQNSGTHGCMELIISSARICL